MLGLRNAIPVPQLFARAELVTLRMGLIEIGARIVETTSRIRITFGSPSRGHVTKYLTGTEYQLKTWR